MGSSGSLVADGPVLGNGEPSLDRRARLDINFRERQPVAECQWTSRAKNRTDGFWFTRRFPTMPACRTDRPPVLRSFDLRDFTDNETLWYRWIVVILSNLNERHSCRFYLYCNSLQSNGGRLLPFLTLCYFFFIVISIYTLTAWLLIGIVISLIVKFVIPMNVRSLNGYWMVIRTVRIYTDLE